MKIRWTLTKYTNMHKPYNRWWRVHYVILNLPIVWQEFYIKVNKR